MSGRGLLRDGARLGLGMAAAQGLLLACMPLWSRQFGAAEFAVLGLWTAVSGLVSVAVTARLETVLMLPEDEAEAAALAGLALRLIGLLSAALALLAAWLPAAWLARTGLAGLGPWLPLAVLAGGASAVQGLVLAWLNRQQAWSAINRQRLLMALSTALAVSLAGALGWAPGLWLGHGLGAALAAGLALWPARGLWAARPVGGWRALAARHREAPLYLWPAALMDSLTQQWPFLLAVLWYGEQAAGQFTLAWRSLALPLFMVSGALGAVFYQRFTRLVTADRAAARRLLRQVWLPGCGAVLLLWAGLALAGPALFALAFGEAWRGAGQLAATLAPMVGLMALSSATSGSLLALGGQRLVPLFGLAMLLGRPLAFWWAADGGRLGLALQAWLLLEALLILLYNTAVWRRLGAPHAA